MLTWRPLLLDSMRLALRKCDYCYSISINSYGCWHQRDGIKNHHVFPFQSGGRWWKDEAGGRGWVQWFQSPSDFWHCWLADWKDIWPINTCAAGLWRFFTGTIGLRNPTVNQLTPLHLENGVFCTELALFCAVCPLLAAPFSSECWGFVKLVFIGLIHLLLPYEQLESTEMKYEYYYCYFKCILTLIFFFRKKNYFFVSYSAQTDYF